MQSALLKSTEFGVFAHGTEKIPGGRSEGGGRGVHAQVKKEECVSTMEKQRS